MSENPQPAKNKGGRPKGRRNKLTLGKLIGIGGIFTDKMESDGWDKFLNSEQPMIAFKAFQLALSYKRGLPKQEIKHSGAVAHVLTEADRAAAKEIVEKLKGS